MPSMPRSVVVADEIGHARDLRVRQAAVREKRRRHGRALLFLPLAVGIAVFLTAERAGDIVCDGGNLEDPLCPGGQPPPARRSSARMSTRG